MKSFAAVIIAVVATTAAPFTLAGTGDSARLDQCKADIEQTLGAQTRTRLYGIKRGRDGSRLRIKAIPQQGDSLLLSCNIDRDGILSLVTSDGLALTAPVFETADKVSLSD